MGILAATGEQAVAIAFDLAQLQHAEQTKQQQEIGAVVACLGNLRSDVRFGDIRLAPGPHPNDPPDLVATIFGKSLNVEVAQVHLPAQLGGRAISAYKRFEELRAALLKSSYRLGRVYRKHRDKFVTVWFGDSSASYTAPVPQSAEAVIEMLRKFDPPPPQERIPQNSKGFSKQSDDVTVGMTWGPLMPDYRSSFRTATGFDIGLAHNRTLRQSEMCKELVRVIQQHDNPVNDLLVVSTNAPLRSGLYFPSSAQLAELLFSAPDPLLGWRPTHLKNIVLHNFKEPTKFRWLVGSDSVLV